MFMLHHFSMPELETQLKFFSRDFCVLSEAWGQLGAAEIQLTPMVKELDPSRPVLSVTGWRGTLENQFRVVFIKVEFH
jgi:hypothetical protein